MLKKMKLATFGSNAFGVKTSCTRDVGAISAPSSLREIKLPHPLLPNDEDLVIAFIVALVALNYKPENVKPDIGLLWSA
jgi:hypothetical protein